MLHRRKALALLAGSVPFLSQDPTPGPAPKPKLAAGVIAPKLRLNDHLGEVVQVGSAKRWSVLAFFPKAATPG